MSSSFKEALQCLRDGKPIVLVDDGAARTNLYLAASAERITPELVSFIVCESRGVVCAAVPEERIKDLGIPLMPGAKESGGPDFTVSIEARQGVRTGISAADRARTLSVLSKTTDPRVDLVMPGHIFPVSAKSGGVLVRVAPAEALVDLLTLAGTNPVGAFSHCLGDRGELLSAADVEALLKRTGTVAVSVSDIIRARLAKENVVEEIAESRLPTEAGGVFRAVCFRSKIDNAEHLALIKGELSEEDDSGKQLPVLVRVHTENRLGDLLGAPANRSREQLNAALKQIDEAGRGVLIYIRHPRRGLLQKQVGEFAEGNQVQALTTSRMREYGIGSQILSRLGVKRICLLTNSSWDIPAVSAFNLEIAGSVGFSSS